MDPLWDPLLREFDHVPPGWWYPAPPPALPRCPCACSACGESTRSSPASDLLLALFVMVTVTFFVCLWADSEGDSKPVDGDARPPG